MKILDRRAYHCPLYHATERGSWPVRDRKNEKLYTEDIVKQPGSRLDAGVRAQALLFTQQSNLTTASKSLIRPSMPRDTVRVQGRAPHTHVKDAQSQRVIGRMKPWS